MRSRPRTTISLAGFVLLVLSARGHAQGRQEFRPAPRFEGSTIPTTPRQDEPWTPPETALPRFLVGATATLCEQGLADPRGCDYRAIEVGLGGVWAGDGGVAGTH